MGRTQHAETLPFLPERRLWTVAEFDDAAARGIIKPDERLELIEGEVIYKVTPQESRHTTGIRAVEEALRRAFAVGYDVRVQMPLVFGTRSKPEPDIAVVAGTFRDYAGSHPTTAVLVVEVSGSSLAFDRTTKAGLYARAGIPEYWILNLVERVLEVHRDPAPMAGKPLGHAYGTITRDTESETVSALAVPDRSIPVSDLLP